MNSVIALKLYGAVKCGLIKSNAMFWREYSDIEKIEQMDFDLVSLQEEVQRANMNLICVFDDHFPKFTIALKNSEKPFLFAYRGDITLLHHKEKNVAVVGVLTPTEDIVQREQTIIEQLVKNNKCIVSGLAKGCDCVAHRSCIAYGGKTIAILPCTLNAIYPKCNEQLADDIVEQGGLLLSEYITQPMTKYDLTKRLIERDRLQALLATNIILVASYEQGYGDSGSRHAMEKAKAYHTKRWIMYDEQLDKNKDIFGLNKKLIEDGATIITTKTLQHLLGEE